jgi:hypothetical protein
MRLKIDGVWRSAMRRNSAWVVLVVAGCGRSAARKPAAQPAAAPQQNAPAQIQSASERGVTPGRVTAAAPAGAASYVEIKEPSACLTGGNILAVSGAPGEFTFDGSARIKDPMVTVYANPELDHIHFELNTAPTRESRWGLDFASDHPGLPFTTREYMQAVRSRGVGQMGSTLDVIHDSSGCMRTRGKFRIYDLEWVGNKVERFTGTFTQHCDERPEVLTGCLHFENPFLRQADADLSHAASTAPATVPPVPLPALVGPGSVPSHETYRAHDPTPCLGGGNALFVDAGPGDPLVVGQQFVSDSRSMQTSAVGWSVSGSRPSCQAKGVGRLDLGRAKNHSRPGRTR